MDSQLKKGFIETLVLAALKYEDSYGYQINQTINEVMTLSESTLYPILRRLQKQGFLETYQTVYNSRVRKYYRMTQAGLARLNESEKDIKEILKIYEFVTR